ncbi:MAG: UDP-N-acetylmuramate dehydrogenase [Alphaproteobacteria bacterium]|nr:UDP-N-acetylmuramate dehydrogenase [Alphaproteobacteria bacterium]
MFEGLFNKSSELKDSLPEVRGKYLENVKLSKHTWFGVGGPAEILYLPEDEDDLRLFLLKKPESIPVTIIGGGSNLLVRDGGIMGVVIKLDNPNFKKIRLEDGVLKVGAGVNNSDLKKFMLENSVGGMEFITSVPGKIGGLLRTNAGCFGGNVSQVLVSAKIMNDWGEIHEVEKDDFNFSYRSSTFPENWIILEASFKCVTKERKEIEELFNEHKKYRETHQPINKRTAGSTFKNPDGLSAWKLIEDAGCKGLKVGGAEVSQMHSNFLINNGNATAEDIEKLGEMIIQKVFEKTSITLEWEVRRMGVKR